AGRGRGAERVRLQRGHARPDQLVRGSGGDVPPVGAAAPHPVALSQRTGAPSAARRNGSGSLSPAGPGGPPSSSSSDVLPPCWLAWAPEASSSTDLSRSSDTMMSPLAPVTAVNRPRSGV